MNKLAALSALIFASPAFAASISCFGADSFGQFFQVRALEAPETARLIVASPQGDPTNIKVTSDKIPGLKLSGSGSLNLDAIPITAGGTTTELFPMYTAEWPSVEGPAKLTIVVGKKDPKKKTYPGVLRLSEPGVIQPPVPLSCNELF